MHTETERPNEERGSARGAMSDRAAPRAEVLADLRRGYRWMDGITWLYRFAAAGYGCGTLLAIAALANPEVPLGAGLMVVALFATMTVFLIVSAIQLHLEPFLWTLLTACLASVVFVAHLFGPNPLGYAHLWSLAWALLFWAAVPATLRVQRSMEAHLDLYILHHSSRTTRRSIGRRTPEERHGRLLRVLQRASRRAWKLSAAAAATIVVASAAGAWTIVAGVRPPGPSASLAQFEQAWNAGDDSALLALLHPQLRESKAAWLEGMADGYGWGSARPPLADPRVLAAELGVGADYGLGGVTLRTSWGRDERDWFAMELHLPPPPLDSALERLRRAWDDSDVESLAGLYAKGFEERMTESLSRSIESRGWKPLPELDDLRVTLRTPDAGEEADRADVILITAGGTLESEWRFLGDGRWHLHALYFPEPARD